MQEAEVSKSLIFNLAIFLLNYSVAKISSNKVVTTFTKLYITSCDRSQMKHKIILAWLPVFLFY